MSRQRGMGFDEIEALIYRLFAEKQFALALMALIMVANLISAQFLLLRMVPPPPQRAGAPSSSERVDVACSQAGLRALDGAAVQPERLRGKKVVVHLDGASNQCVVEASHGGAAELVVGVTTE